MPTLAEAEAAWNGLLEEAGTDRARIPIAVSDQMRRNPITPGAVGPVAGPFNEIMSHQAAMFLRPTPGQPTNILNVFRAFARPPMTPAQEDALRAYLIDIYRRTPDTLKEVSVPGVVDQLKVKQLSKSGLMGKDFDSTLLRSYFSDSKDSLPLEAFKGSLQIGRPGRLATGPGERGFTRRRALPPPPGGRGPAAAGAPQGGRKKTTRLPSRSSRRRRSKRSQRNRGGAKSL